MDKVIDNLDILVRAKADLACDVVNLKINKLGGIITAAIVHIAHSTPEPFRFTSTDFNSYVTRSIADGAPKFENGFMTASDQPGLGIEPKMDVLGKAELVVE